MSFRLRIDQVYKFSYPSGRAAVLILAAPVRHAVFAAAVPVGK